MFGFDDIIVLLMIFDLMLVYDQVVVVENLYDVVIEVLFEVRLVVDLFVEQQMIVLFDDFLEMGEVLEFFGLDGFGIDGFGD